MKKSYFHISSHGLESNDIFRSRPDFIQGMNDIALCVLGYDVWILAFCLMSNHFHFVLYGHREECVRFANEYKRKCAMRMRSRFGDVKGMKDVSLWINEIDSEEYLGNVIAYVLRNPISAGLFMMPYHYPWSSISLYFRGEQLMRGEKLNDMGIRKRRRILCSHQSVPDTYIIDEHGMILPSCYVKSEIVEKLFRHPARLMVSLARKVENDVEVRLGISKQVTFTDQELLTQMGRLVELEFGKRSIYQLTMDERIRLCLLLKRNFGANVKQISRVTRLSPEIVSRVV